MATLYVRKVGSKAAKIATFGGDPSQWAVSDGEVSWRPAGRTSAAFSSISTPAVDI